jgi:hypothetical protein
MPFFMGQGWGGLWQIRNTLRPFRRKLCNRSVTLVDGSTQEVAECFESQEHDVFSLFFSPLV